MPRYPSVWRSCTAVRLAERRGGRASIEARRAAAEAIPAPVGDVDGLQVSEHRVPVAGGTIPLRVHRAPGGGARPAHLLFHAGSFCYGVPQELDGLAALYARRAGCAVLAPAYRRAPEHPYPTAPEDGYATLRWLVDNADTLGVDPGRLSVGGVSAGGCIAAAVALMARDRGGPPLRFQLLEIPVTDLTSSSPSVRRYGTGYLFTRAEMLETFAAYAPLPAQRWQPYASPLFAPNLTGLPPAMVLTAQFDPLRDEGEAYARRLAAAGVPVRLVRARGHVHSSTYSPMRSARRLRERAAAALADAYAGCRTE